MNNNGTNLTISSCEDCPCYATQQAWEPYHMWYQTAASSIGVLANALILATLLAARVSHSCHVYVLALTLADLGYSLCRLVIFHYLKLPQGYMGLWQCRSLQSAYNLCRGLANWAMVLLAADRLRVVAAPLRTHAKGRRLRCAAALTCAACLAMLAVNLPRLVHFVGYHEVQDSSGQWLVGWCFLLKTELARALRGLELALTIHIPVVGNAAVNLALCACLWRLRQRRKRLTQAAPPSQRSAAAAAPSGDAERQLTQMLVATSVMHSVFSLPLAWLEAVNLKEAFVTTTDYFLYLCINYAFGVFYSWHAFVNLPIYLVYNSAFRAQFLRLLLPCRYRRERPESHTRTCKINATTSSVSNVSEAANT